MGGMTGLLLLLWVGVTVSTAVNLQKRIIGGRDCQDTERQYHVILISKGLQNSYLCGGSLISERWILTAAHCKGRTTLVQIAGHGSATTGPNSERVPGTSATLQCAKINVIDCQGFKDEVKKYSSYFYWKRKREHWGCFQSPKVDICPGDSGGGVIYNDMIYGVISFTGSLTYACARPGAFMDICNEEYNQWIYKTIAK